MRGGLRLRTAYHRLLLRAIGFNSKDRIGDKTLVHKAVLRMTTLNYIETVVRTYHLWFAETLARQGETRLPKRVIFEQLLTQKPMVD